MSKYLLLVIIFISSIAQAQVSPRPTATQRITLNPADKPFYHGIASGDPTPNSVMIWTRVTPDSGGIGDVKIYWQVATDINFTNVVSYGYDFAREYNDYTFKHDVCGLQPNTYYYYMFRALDKNTIIGRTKTAPVGDNDSARFAVVSCSNYEHGYFHAYKEIANRNDCDGVIHLGDYIYEYEVGGFSAGLSDRTNEPINEIITLEDYRTRHSHYKLDADLKRLHQLQPFMTVWDDHETANDSYRDGAENHTNGSEGNWQDRKRNGVEAYNEWMPLRKPDPLDTIRIWRKLKYGNLMDLIMIDSRLYDRDEQSLANRNDASRKLLGTLQKNWLKTQLSDTTSRYKIMCNQVMFAPLEVFGIPVNADQWDGYNADRQEIQNHIRLNSIKNVVVLTGDIHTSWANDVPGPGYVSSSGANSICTEFVTTSVTSSNFSLPVPESVIRTLNPHMKYVKLTDHGYSVLDINKNRVQNDFLYTIPVETPTYTASWDKSFYKNNNENFLRNTTTQLSGHLIPAVNPPLLADQTIYMNAIDDSLYYILNKNTNTAFCLLPPVPNCGGYSISLLDSTNNGLLNMSIGDSCGTYIPNTNYSGFDTAKFLVCQNNPFYCDTVKVYFQINGFINRTYILATIPMDSTYNRCISYDDLYGSIANSNVSISPSHGTATLSNDSCITYVPNAGFTGVDTIMIYACDSITPIKCDTVYFIITVKPSYNIQYIYAYITPDSIYKPCVGFDELRPPYTSRTLYNNTSHSFTTLSVDTCLNYIPAVGFRGNDTLVLIACKSGVPLRCDTIIYIINVDESNDVNFIKENLVVFGVNPNPFDDEIVIQYYLYKDATIEVSLTDIQGKKVISSSILSKTGLNYGKVKGDGVAKGTYVLSLKVGNEIYSKKIVKE
jgi:alkaline phosphatase D